MLLGEWDAVVTFPVMPKRGSINKWLESSVAPSPLHEDAMVRGEVGGPSAAANRVGAADCPLRVGAGGGGGPAACVLDVRVSTARGP